MKLVLLSRLLLLASLLMFPTTPTQIHAQLPIEIPPGSPGVPVPPPTQPQIIALPDGPSAVIIYSSGAHLQTRTADEGSAELIGLEKNEVVVIVVQYPVTKVGQRVNVVPLDGGELVGGTNKVFTVAGDGTIELAFKVGEAPGLYQLSLHDGVDEVGLHFWVLDEENPSNNPPVVSPTSEELE